MAFAARLLTISVGAIPATYICLKVAFLFIQKVVTHSIHDPNTFKLMVFGGWSIALLIGAGSLWVVTLLPRSRIVLLGLIAWAVAIGPLVGLFFVFPYGTVSIFEISVALSMIVTMAWLVFRAVEDQRMSQASINDDIAI